MESEVCPGRLFCVLFLIRMSSNPLPVGLKFSAPFQSNGSSDLLKEVRDGRILVDTALLGHTSEGSALQPQLHGVSAFNSSSSATRLPVQICEKNPSSQRDSDPCPYYYDEVFELEMYRGPGFRQFHPVLGSMAGHKEICAEWDARHSKDGKGNHGHTRVSLEPHNGMTSQQSRPPSLAVDQTGGSLTSSKSHTLDLDKEQERNCLEQVLSVFPQVQHDFVRNLYREHHPGRAGSLMDSRASDSQVVANVISEISDMQSIPLQKNLKRKRSTGLEGDDATIKWNKDVPKNATYYKEAIALLAGEFIRIPTHYINKILRQRQSLFDAFQSLAESENTSHTGSPKRYKRLTKGRVCLERKYQKSACEKREETQYVSIVNEFQAARHRSHCEDSKRRKRGAEDEAEANNFALHKLQGSLVDCQCCFDDTPINRMVHCESDESHFFCNKCINKRAEEQIGGLKHEMTCMDISGCGAELSKETLARALPLRISNKLAEIQQLAEIRAAGLEGLEHCPFCDFQAICAPIEDDSVFQCLNPECEEHSCRKCKAISHVPRSCEEAKKERGLDARHAVEEARSEAIMRSCPRCQVKIVKSAGCNKMTCSKCYAVMCYVCKKDITGRNYNHFGSGKNSCHLSDTADEDRHRQEADKAEKAAIAAAKARDEDVDEEDLRIEAHSNERQVRPGGQVLPGWIDRPWTPQHHPFQMEPVRVYQQQLYQYRDLIRDPNGANDWARTTADNPLGPGARQQPIPPAPPAPHLVPQPYQVTPLVDQPHPYFHVGHPEWGFNGGLPAAYQNPFQW